MGCDIHAYVEYVDFVQHDGTPYWSCLMSNIGHRDYDFFSVLADCGRGSHQPLFPNRGLPEGSLSFGVARAMWLTVTDDEKLFDEEGFCSRANAEHWGPVKKTAIPQRDGPDRIHEQVMHPDLHSHSWFTCDEFAQIIGHWISSVPHDYPYGVEWDAALAAMRALEERGHKTRMIIAFDN